MLKRRNIPHLPPEQASIGIQGRVKRSVDAQNKNPIRLYCGEEFSLNIAFLPPTKGANVICYTNFNQPNNEWQQLPFQKISETDFEFRMKSTFCGEYAFRIKYSFDGGATWVWDRSPLMHVHVDPLRMKSVRSYTMIPTVLGKTSQWISHLKHVRQMGFNMVHLLPVTQMGHSESPYSAVNFFAIDPSFLENAAENSSGLDEFETFVEAAVESELSLCIDLVLNHVAPDSDLAQSSPNWIVPDNDETNGMQRSGCWHMDEWLKWGDLVRIYYEHPNPETQKAIWAYMREYALFWAYYADYTGGMIRLDNLHNSDENFIGYILKELRTAYPNLIIHAEFFSDSNTLLKRARNWDLNLFLANPWEYPYAENLRAYLQHCHEIGNRVPQYTPITTHDTGSPAELYGNSYAVVPRYFVTALFSTGQTGMVQGGEYEVPHKINFIGRNQDFPYEPNHSIVEKITHINGVLAQYDCLHEAGNLHFVDKDHGAIIAAFRPSSDPSIAGLLLLANFDTTNPHIIDIDLFELTQQPANTLQNVLYRETPFQQGKTFHVELPPCGIAAYSVTREKPTNK